MSAYRSDPPACKSLPERDVLCERPRLETAPAAEGLGNVEVIVVGESLVCSFLTEASDERVILGAARNRRRQCAKEKMVGTRAYRCG